MKTDCVRITVIVTGRSNGKITRKNRVKADAPSMMAASSSSRGIAATNARKSSTENDMPKAISTRMSPNRVLKIPRFCRTQMVGTIAGGMISPDSTSRLATLAAGPGRRWMTKPTMAHRTTRTATEATVRMMLFRNAVTSM
jgi:hypothetical protein